MNKYLRIVESNLINGHKIILYRHIPGRGIYNRVQAIYENDKGVRYKSEFSAFGVKGEGRRSNFKKN